MPSQTLTGSPKQIAWAEDIIAERPAVLREIAEVVDGADSPDAHVFAAIVTALAAAIENADSASTVIHLRDDITSILMMPGLRAHVTAQMDPDLVARIDEYDAWWEAGRIIRAIWTKERIDPLSRQCIEARKGDGPSDELLAELEAAQEALSG